MNLCKYTIEDSNNQMTDALLSKKDKISTLIRIENFAK